MSNLLKSMRDNGIRTGIITDGRPLGQRAKIKALGLSKLVDDIIVTDELGGVAFRKPNDISFRIMQTKWQMPFREMVYIGDNAAKDFQAPRQLGMHTIYFNNRDGLYHGGNYPPLLCDYIAENLEQMRDCCLKITRAQQS